MPATRMRFRGNGTGTFYIDLNRALSLQLRKLHRQKVITTVYGGYFVDAPTGNDTSRVDLAVAPNTWPTKRSINRSFALWRKMIAQTLSQTEGMTSGKWNDFKVYLNNAMGSSPLLPVDADNHPLCNESGNTPEWDYSTLTTADPDDDPLNAPDAFELMIVGPHAKSGSGNNVNYTRVSMMQSWLDSRATADGPEPLHADSAATTTDPLSNLFDAGDVDDDRLEIINAEGDLPPYDRNSYFGIAQAAGAQNNLQRVSTAVSTPSAHVQPIHGFEAICGLLEVNIVRAEGDWEIVLDVESNGVKF